MGERTDTERMDWLEAHGVVLARQESEQQDGSDVEFWMTSTDLDASNASAIAPTARQAIDKAMSAALAQ